MGRKMLSAVAVPFVLLPAVAIVYAAGIRSRSSIVRVAAVGIESGYGLPLENDPSVAATALEEVR